jgi:hypothetical protein
MPYVDGSLLAVPTRKLRAYRRITGRGTRRVPGTPSVTPDEETLP